MKYNIETNDYKRSIDSKELLKKAYEYIIQNLIYIRKDSLWNELVYYNFKIEKKKVLVNWNTRKINPPQSLEGIYDTKEEMYVNNIMNHSIEFVMNKEIDEKLKEFANNPKGKFQVRIIQNINIKYVILNKEYYTLQTTLTESIPFPTINYKMAIEAKDSLSEKQYFLIANSSKTPIDKSQALRISKLQKDIGRNIPKWFRLEGNLLYYTDPSDLATLHNVYMVKAINKDTKLSQKYTIFLNNKLTHVIGIYLGDKFDLEDLNKWREEAKEKAKNKDSHYANLKENIERLIQYKSNNDEIQYSGDEIYERAVECQENMILEPTIETSSEYSQLYDLFGDLYGYYCGNPIEWIPILIHDGFIQSDLKDICIVELKFPKNTLVIKSKKYHLSLNDTLDEFFIVYDKEIEPINIRKLTKSEIEYIRIVLESLEIDDYY